MIAYFFEAFRWGWGDTAYWIIALIGLYFLHKGWNKLASATMLVALAALIGLSAIL